MSYQNLMASHNEANEPDRKKLRSLDNLDYVVCWENRWQDFPKPGIEIGLLLRET